MPALRDLRVARHFVNDIAREGGEGKARGIDLQEAHKIVREGDPKFNPDADMEIWKAHEQWRQFDADRLTYWQRGGMIDRQTATDWRVRNPNYVPKNRTNRVRINLSPAEQKKFKVDSEHIIVEMPPGEKITVRTATGSELRSPQDIIRAFKGSLRMLADPIESDALLSSRMFKEVELNKVQLEAKQYANVPGSGIELVDAPAGIAERVTMDDVKQAMSLDGILDDAVKDPNRVMQLNSSMFNPAGLPDNYSVGFENGKRFFLKYDDPAMAQALGFMRTTRNSALDGFLGGKIGDFSRFLAKTQRAGVTMEPGFILALNTIRDTWQAMSYSPAGFIPVYDNIRALKNYFGRSEVYDLWARSGGMQAHLSAVDTPVLKRGIENFLAPENKTYLQSMAHLVKHPIQAMQAQQEVSEA